MSDLGKRSRLRFRKQKQTNKKHRKRNKPVMPGLTKFPLYAFRFNFI